MPDKFPDSNSLGDDTMIITLRPGLEDSGIEDSLADEESLFARDPFGKLIRVDRPTEQDLAKSVRIKVDGSDWFEVPKAVPATDAQGNILYHPDGTTVVRATTIYDAAKRRKAPAEGKTRIPILCHQDHQTPVAVCRACVVQIVSIDPRDPSKKKEQRKLLPACQHRVEEGMEVHTLWSPEAKFRKTVRASVQTLYELLAGDHCHKERDQVLRHREQKYRNELDDLAETLRANWLSFPGDAHMPREQADRDRMLGIAAAGKPAPEKRFAAKPPNPDLLVGWVDGLIDTSQVDLRSVSQDEIERIVIAPPFVVDHNNCILCDRCIRACGEVKPFNVIGRSGKGATTQIAFDLRGLPMAESSCRACGECMTACPTGAISFQYRVMDASPKRLAEVLDRSATVVEADELLRHPLFARMSKAFLEWNRGAIRRRSVEPGDLIAQEGEYGTTAFIIEKGYVAVCRSGAKSPPYLPHSEKPDVAAGLARLKASYGTVLFVQGPDPNEPVGEMAPMSHARRNANLVAVTTGSILEIDRNVLFVLLRDPKNREKLDLLYAQRALYDILLRLAQGTGIFSCLNPDEIKSLTGHIAPAAQLVRAQPNYVIFKEGEPADEFYLIRLGFVGLSSNRTGGWMRPPLKQGDCFGEVAFLTKIWPADDLRLPPYIVPGVRTATCTALDHAELIRVPGDVFATFLKRRNNAVIFSKLRDQCIRVFSEGRPDMTDDLTGRYVDLGLYQGQELLVLDLEKCTRCDECVKACADSHGGVTRVVRDGPRFGHFLVAISCRSCHDPYCLNGCPVDAIHREGHTLEIRIDDHCIGCGLCAHNCPYGSIHMVEHDETGRIREIPRDEWPSRGGSLASTQHTILTDTIGVDVGGPVRKARLMAVNCDLCSGSLSGPRCVYACPHDAAHRLPGERILEIAQQRRVPLQEDSILSRLRRLLVGNAIRE